MSIHKNIDNLSIKMGSLYGEKVQFFREGLISSPVTEVVPELKMEFTPPSGEGEYEIPVRYGEFTGTARYSLLNWVGNDKPCLIYHHGSGETNYTARIKRILPRSVCPKLNLFAVSIPCNRSMKEYIYGTGSLSRFCILLASSVRIFESLNLWMRGQGGGKITAAGISLGGWITNLHFSLYGSMDEYRPLFAGAALDHLFTDTVYRNMTSAEARRNPSVLKKVLNFESLFGLGNTDRVFPLLARQDQYIDFERQKAIYTDRNLSILEKGHTTGTMDIKALRKHLLEEIEVSNVRND